MKTSSRGTEPRATASPSFSERKRTLLLRVSFARRRRRLCSSSSSSSSSSSFRDSNLTAFNSLFGHGRSARRGRGRSFACELRNSAAEAAAVKDDDDDDDRRLRRGYAGEDVRLRKNADLYERIRSKSERGGTRERGEEDYDDDDDDDKRIAARRKKPEVLAPAGGWRQLKAACAAGADCVYFGLESLNARARANNFEVKELKEVMDFLHERAVKGYVTMNVLVFDDELEECERLVRACASCGVDAMIVQDVGAARLVKKIAPNMHVHGSTQMTITDPEGAKFARDIGCERVVVGRELSISEIRTVVEKSPETTVEAFTHGALCVSYSGQCFSSEAWGGRSANRGQCAQACRMPYGFVVNGEVKAMGDEKYLLSPQDLMAVDLVPQLIEAGVSCFKIEGRLKGEEYVSLTTAAYRRAVDLAWENQSIDKRDLLTDESREQLRQVFARAQDENHDGLTTGFLEGSRHQTIVRGRSPRHRGVIAGRVFNVDALNERVTIEVSESSGVLKRGFGVVFDCGTPELDEEGGFIYEIFNERGVYVDSSELCSNDIATLAFARNSIDFSKIQKGNIVWRTSTTSGEKKEQQRKREENEEEIKTSQKEGGRDAVVCVVSGSIDKPMKISFFDDYGNVGEASTSTFISEAKKQPMNLESIAKAIGELGGTPFVLNTERIDCAKLLNNKKEIFVPAGEIKKARRAAVEMLLEKRRNIGANKSKAMASDSISVSEEMYKSEIEKWWGIESSQSFEKKDVILLENEESIDNIASPKLTVLCRTMEQVETCCKFEFLNEIQCDFLEVHGLREAVKKIQAAGKKAVVATPRVLKPDEEKLWRFYLSLNADALLVRSAGLLRKLNELITTSDGDSKEKKKYPRLRGDFSLNAANVLTTSTFLEAFNLERISPTHDLNARQIRNLAHALPPKTAMSKIEVVLHMHLPIFHTEHCVFCRFLSDGNSYKDCGHPCETNDARLRDSFGKDHLVLADQGCRNTVFNAEAQSGAMFYNDWVSNGNIRNFRVELVDEPAHETKTLLETYDELIKGSKSSKDVFAILLKIEDKNGIAQGCTVGSFAIRSEQTKESMKKTAVSTK